MAKSKPAKKSGEAPPKKADTTFLQRPIPGLENQDPENRRVIEAALAYKAICKKRAAMSKHEKELRDNLNIAMMEEGYKDGYKFGNIVVNMIKDSKPKVDIRNDAPPAKKKAKKTEQADKE